MGDLILAIDDEADILELIRYNLEKDGYQVRTALDGEKGLEIARRDPVRLILLDLMLPGLDGLEICRRLKRNPQLSRVPIVMLTAKSEEADVVTGLELGADDYITKPFSPRVLLARIRAVLRRFDEATAEEVPVLRAGDIVIDQAKHQVRIGDEEAKLTHTEFRLLYHLARRRGRVFTRNQLMDAILGEDTISLDRTIDVHVTNLRKKLGKAAECIETVRGVGYRFRE